MADPYRDEGERASPSEARVREAVRTWARGVLGGPRKLDEQITGIEARDDVIVRVATEIVRRDLVERRTAAQAPAHRPGDLAHPASIDPFAGSLHELRTRTEHSAPCSTCQGSGLAGCRECDATGRARCPNCGGSGRTYAKSKRGAKCKVCHETGRLRCSACDGTAKVACVDCAGAGQQLVWLEYVESVRTVTSFLRESPILVAHRHLREPRFLGPRDLAWFTPFVTLQRACAIPSDALEGEDAVALAQAAPAIDPRLERVREQQFLRFGVLRRDVRYEMCGTVGTVALSGTTLLGASTADALRPIRLRLAILATTAIILAALGSWWYSRFSGPTAYFGASNGRLAVVIVVGLVAAVVAINGALRRLRPGFRWWSSNRFENTCAAVFAALFASVPVLAFVGRPTSTEARTAISAGDLVRARVVVDALKATRSSADVTQVNDDLLIAEAERLSGNARIAKLDEAANDPGPRARAARDAARQARVELVRGMLAARQTSEALSRLERWSSELATLPEVPELRAQAYEQKAASCADAACVFLATRSAITAHASPARSLALSAARARVLAALDPKDAADVDPLRRLHALRRAATIGRALLAATPDAELSEKAVAAGAAAEAELSKVLLIGAPIALVDEVLDRPRPGSPLTAWRELAGVAVYAHGVAGRCTGLYVIGSVAGSRSLSGKEPGLRRLLAQATGRTTATIRSRPKSSRRHEISKWTEGSTPVLARWNGEALLELRIGDATP